jgi:acyl-CoA reductase-like NAD-dependent aldehyde dehydrogenase
MLKASYPYYLANRAVAANQDLPVIHKYSGAVATRVARGDRSAIDRAIAAATAAAAPFAAWPAHRRQDVLMHCVRRFRERADELAHNLCVEAGKPIRDARVEVARLIDTFRIAAEEAVRIHGEVLSLEISPRGEGYRGMYKRVPVGPCSFISTFAYPLNLAAHKIAPALAVGCPFVFKPHDLAPLGALAIAEVLAETDLPEGTFSILPCDQDGADLLTTDPRPKLLSFTGGAATGWALKARAGRKRVVLELGGNDAVIVERDADLDDALPRLVQGAFHQTGSVQRILVHDAIYARVRDALVTAAATLPIGDPLEEATVIGPMMSEADAVQLETWITEAVGAGATVLCGGRRNGSLFPATLLENVPRSAALAAEEGFGPIAVLGRFSDFEAALAEVNATAYGLQAGVFTRDLYNVQRAWDVLDVGGVTINEVPSWRIDNMPYGGVKDSGRGREGGRWAIEELTEIRLLVVRTLGTR